jgi:hypothetical protein
MPYRMIFYLCLLLCSVSSRAFAQDLSGLWYGEGYQGRNYLHWLAQHAPSGELSIEFRQYKDCKLTMQSHEAGVWKFSGGVLATEVFMMDGSKVFYSERYHLEKHDKAGIEYRNVRSGVLFKARRVDEDFAWPACDPAKPVS